MQKLMLTLSQSCFNECAVDFISGRVSTKERECIRRCSGKFWSYFNRFECGLPKGPVARSDANAGTDDESTTKSVIYSLQKRHCLCVSTDTFLRDPDSFHLVPHSANIDRHLFSHSLFIFSTSSSLSKFT